MTAPWDLADLYKPAPPGPAQNMMYRQGKILTWDPYTAANTVDIGGTVFTDLTVLNTSEALILAPGDSVAVLSIGTEEGGKSGGKTYAILGRLTIPNTPAAATALSIVRTFSDQIDTRESTSSGAYVDLASVGPIVTVDIAPSGRCLVTVGALIEVTAAAGLGISTGSGFMGFTLAGANTLIAVPARSAVAEVRYDATPASTLEIGISVGASRLVLLEGLNQGSTTFTAKYATAATTASFFSGRNITVIPL